MMYCTENLERYNKNMSKKKISIFHISEVFLYEYYFNQSEYEFTQEDEAQLYIKEAAQDEQEGHIDKALQKYICAHHANPVSVEIYANIIRCYRLMGNLDELYHYTIESYRYCCTRAELARYYRNLGYFYLEKYQPDLAAALYQYSILYYESKQAENEIAFLNKAMKKEMKKNDIGQLQKMIIEAGIPVEADLITLGLRYKAGEEAEKKKDYRQALDCYKMVYDLSNDKEIANRISYLEKEHYSDR